MATKSKTEGPRQDQQQPNDNTEQRRDTAGATGGENVTSRGARPKEQPRPEGAIATRTRSQADATSTHSSAQSSPRDGNARNSEAPAITINGTSQGADQNSAQSNATVIHRSNANDGAANYDLPPPGTDFEYRQGYKRYVRHDDDSPYDFDRYRRAHSADERFRYNYDSWAEYVLSTPEMTRYLERRRRLGLPPTQSQDVPHGSYLTIDNPAAYHVPPPPVLQQARPTMHSVVEGAMLRSDRQQRPSARDAKRDDRRGDQQQSTRVVTIRTPTQEVTTEHGPDKPYRFGEVGRLQAANRDPDPLDTSTPKASTSTSAAQRRGDRQSSGPQATYVSTRKSRGAKRRSKANYEVVYDGEYDTSRDETVDGSMMSTSSTSDTTYRKPRRSASQMRTPVFDGNEQEYHIFRELFLATARDAGWSEIEKGTQLRLALRKKAKNVLGPLGSSENWTFDRVLSALDGVYARQKSYATVQIQMRDMKRKADQTIHDFATQVRDAARPASMTHEEREWLVRSTFVLGLSDYPDMIAFIDRECQNKKDSQEAIDLAIRYERDYMVSSTSRVAQQQASAAQVDTEEADVNWMYRQGRQNYQGRQMSIMERMEKKIQELTEKLETVMTKTGATKEEKTTQGQSAASEESKQTERSQNWKNNKFSKQDRYNKKNYSGNSYNRRDHRGYYNQRPQFVPQQSYYYMQPLQPQMMPPIPTPMAAPVSAAGSTTTQPVPIATTAPVTTPHQLTVPVQHMFQQPPQVILTPAEAEQPDTATSDEQSDE